MVLRARRSQWNLPINSRSPNSSRPGVSIATRQVERAARHLHARRAYFGVVVSRSVRAIRRALPRRFWREPRLVAPPPVRFDDHAGQGPRDRRDAGDYPRAAEIRRGRGRPHLVFALSRPRRAPRRRLADRRARRHLRARPARSGRAIAGIRCIVRSRRDGALSRTIPLHGVSARACRRPLAGARHLSRWRRGNGRSSRALFTVARGRCGVSRKRVSRGSCMAVYTDVAAEDLSRFLAGYDIGALLSYKGIAEGVENSNFLVHTAKGYFILTLYERRVAERDLPFFLSLMEHLAGRDINCPQPVKNRAGKVLGNLAGRPAAIVTFLDGMWIRRPSAAHCGALGEALARLHLAGSDFAMRRDNALSVAGWRQLYEGCRERAHKVDR